MLRRHADLSCLVNCAGLYRSRPFRAVSADEFDATIAVNLRAPFLAAQALADHLERQKRPGCIVNVSSTAGRMGSSAVDYAASKAGLDNLTRSLARVLAPLEIRVNAVAPGLVETPMGATVPGEVRERTLAAPSGRIAAPEDIADVVAFLLSPQSRHVNGQSLAVCGGLT